MKKSPKSLSILEAIEMKRAVRLNLHCARQKAGWICYDLPAGSRGRCRSWKDVFVGFLWKKKDLKKILISKQYLLFFLSAHFMFHGHLHKNTCGLEDKKPRKQKLWPHRRLWAFRSSPAAGNPTSPTSPTSQSIFEGILTSTNCCPLSWQRAWTPNLEWTHSGPINCVGFPEGLHTVMKSPKPWNPLASNHHKTMAPGHTATMATISNQSIDSVTSIAKLWTNVRDGKHKAKNCKQKVKEKLIHILNKQKQLKKGQASSKPAPNNLQLLAYTRTHKDVLKTNQTESHTPMTKPVSKN